MYDNQTSDFNQICVHDSIPIHDETSENFTVHQNPMSLDLVNLTSECQSQAAVIQALIDLDSSENAQQYSEFDVLNQQNSFENQQKNSKKSCNCAKSHCLKLYCECFARGQSCNGCNCSNCMNNSLFEIEQKKAICSTLEKNPSAFYPKIGCSIKKHNKGCNCKRSNCLKNYCECYEAKISCSDLCRCHGCRNFDEFSQNNTSLPAGAKSALRKSVNKQFSDDGLQYSCKEPINHSQQDLYQHSQPIFNACITNDVIEVACSCMLAQLFEAEQNNEQDISREHAVLSEFGRCLEHILDSVNKLRNFQNSTSNYMMARNVEPVEMPLQIFPVEDTNCGYLYSGESKSYQNQAMLPTQMMELSYKSELKYPDGFYIDNAYPLMESHYGTDGRRIKLEICEARDFQPLIENSSNISNIDDNDCNLIDNSGPDFDVSEANFRLLPIKVDESVDLFDFPAMTEDSNFQTDNKYPPSTYEALTLNSQTEELETEADRATAALNAENVASCTNRDFCNPDNLL